MLSAKLKKVSVSPYILFQFSREELKVLKIYLIVYVNVRKHIIILLVPTYLVHLNKLKVGKNASLSITRPKNLTTTSY